MGVISRSAEAGRSLTGEGMTGKRILAVENNDLVRSFIEDGLVMAGYEVETATNGREALEKIHRTAYDLIISDLRMPEVDGAHLRLADAGAHYVIDGIWSLPWVLDDIEARLADGEQP